MSCIYGPHQFGTEDQGWVAHFLIQALKEGPLSIYGNGKQVRDILFVEDLVEAFILARNHIDSIAGEVFNIGGGPKNTISLKELLVFIEETTGKELHISFDKWRIGDQVYYVSDISKFRKTTGWYPRYSVEKGVQALVDWLVEHHIKGTIKKKSPKKTIAV